jgi:hypothetical protein
VLDVFDAVLDEQGLDGAFLGGLELHQVDVGRGRAGLEVGQGLEPRGRSGAEDFLEVKRGRLPVAAVMVRLEEALDILRWETDSDGV